MRVCLLTLLGALGLFAADPQQLALALKAQSDFDRVELQPIPELSSAANCVQSQAAVLSVSSPEEAALLYFRKGFCALAGATVTGSNRDYLAAAADLDRAVEAWPARMRKPAKKLSPEPVSTGLRILPWIARLHSWKDDTIIATAGREIAAALQEPSCTSNLMPAQQCEQILQTGREWLGWIALAGNHLDDAAKNFAGARETGWPEWVEGQRQFEQGRYAGAVAQYTRAVDTWKVTWQQPGPSLARRFGPAPELPVALADLGGAQLLAGDARAAIASLDASIKADPTNATAIYRRARAREIAGQAEQALADYGLASRTAFANAKDMASGEAHLYRGVMLYRRKEFSRAEDEFSSALNFEIAGPLRADAQAWRHLAAAAGGSCTSERDLLERALPGVSPYFPKSEASQLAANCTTAAARLAGGQ